MVTGLSACFGDPGYGDVSASYSTQDTISVYKRSFFDAAQNPYYATLKDNEKNVYSLIFEELFKGSQKFECPVKTNAEELSLAIDAVLNDHPDLFWLDNKYSYSYDPEEGSVKEITFEFYDFADTPDKLHKAKVALEEAADSVISQARLKTTMVERELFIHDYICQNTVYDEAAPYNQSAYSCLVMHKSVCAGYARSFQYLMNRAGVTCYYVTGCTEKSVEGSGDSGAHSWNMVIINGDYYNVDCLWDDTASESYGSPIYPFFNIPDSEMVNHIRVQMAVKLPSCTATECRYSKQFGPTIEADSIVFADDE